jgi:hypothetical protein
MRIPMLKCIILFTLVILFIPTDLKAFDFSLPNPSPAVLGQRVISDQISAFVEGDSDRAFSYTSLSIRLIFRTPDKFIAMVKKGYLPLYKPGNFRFGKNVVIKGNLYQQVITTDTKGKMWEVFYALILQSDGEWKITKVVINPLHGESI